MPMRTERLLSWALVELMPWALCDQLGKRQLPIQTTEAWVMGQSWVRDTGRVPTGFGKRPRGGMS